MPQSLMTAVLLAALAVYVGFEAWRGIADTAIRDEEASHILLVPVVAGWLVWTRLETLCGVRLRATLSGPIVVALGGVLGWFGFHYGTMSLWHGGALLMVIGAVLGVAGGQVFRRVWPAVLVLVFLIPVPGTVRQEISLPLQNVTARLTAVLFELLGADVERTGNVLVYNGHDVAVAEACNGMRMVFLLVVVCYAVAFANPLRPAVRVLILVLSPICAIACNVIRLVPTVWLYGHYPETLGPLFHDVGGWAMVLVAFGLVMGVIWLLRWLDLPVDQPPGWESADDEPPGVATNRGVSWAVPVVTAVLLLLVGVESRTRPAAADARPFHAEARRVAADTPTAFGGWTGEAVPMPQEAVRLLQPNVLLSRSYHHAATGRRGTLLLVQTRDARDLVGHYPPNCYPSSGWTLLGSRPRDWTVGGLDIPGTEYHFGFEDRHGRREMRVASFLIVPDGGIVRDMGGVRSAAGHHLRRYHGAAQVQVVTVLAMTDAERDAVVTELVGGHIGLIDMLLGTGHDTSPGRKIVAGGIGG